MFNILTPLHKIVEMTYTNEMSLNYIRFIGAYVIFCHRKYTFLNAHVYLVGEVDF